MDNNNNNEKKKVRIILACIPEPPKKEKNPWGGKFLSQTTSLFYHTKGKWQASNVKGAFDIQTMILPQFGIFPIDLYYADTNLRAIKENKIDFINKNWPRDYYLSAENVLYEVTDKKIVRVERTQSGYHGEKKNL